MTPCFIIVCSAHSSLDKYIRKYRIWKYNQSREALDHQRQECQAVKNDGIADNDWKTTSHGHLSVECIWKRFSEFH